MMPGFSFSDTFSLSFRLIDYIKAELRQWRADALKGLMLILVFEDGSPPHLVYLPDVEADCPQGWSIKHLNELNDEDLLEHQGLIIGWKALDAVFDAYMPYGPYFYDIHQLFVDVGAVKEARWTAYQLGKYIYESVEKSIHKNRTKRKSINARRRMIQAALPYLISNKSLQGVIGIYLTNFYDLFTSHHKLQLLYLDDRRRWGKMQPAAESWMVGLAEIALLAPRFHTYHIRFIKLRPILETAGWKQELHATVLKLAEYSYKKWKNGGNHMWLEQAYALAAERHLAHEDVASLVGLYPVNDFNKYLATGRAQRIYRIPLINKTMISKKKGGGMQVTELVSPSFELQSDFGDVALGLPVLKEDMMRKGSGKEMLFVDLQKVLWQNGKKQDLARTLWLTARDMLPPVPSSDWSDLSAVRSLEPLEDMIFKSYHLYNLLTPWQWRQKRYYLYRRRNYQSLLADLRQAILRAQRADDEAHVAYVQGIYNWYACLHDITSDNKETEESILDHLGVTVEKLRLFLSTAAAESQPHRRKNARLLAEVAAYLADHTEQRLPDMRRFRSNSLLKTMGTLVEDQDIRHLSSFFVEKLERYHRLRLRWLSLFEKIDAGKKPPRKELDELTLDYDALLKTLFALPHEQALLHWRCQRDMRRLHNLQNALQTGPVIRLEALNPWVIHGMEEVLSIQARNVGNEIARQFKLILISDVSTDTENFLAESAPGQSDLDVRETRLWRWRVKTNTDILKLKFRYEYKDFAGKHLSAESALTVRVRHQRKQMPLLAANPYIAGTPVSGPMRFFGRTQTLRDIFSRLLTGNTQPIILRGPRRMGKTSILRHIRWLMEKQSRLQSIEIPYSDQDFVSGHIVVETSLQGFNPTKKEYINLFFENILREIEEKIKVRLPQEESVQHYEEEFKRDPVWAFRTILSKWITEYIQAPVVVLLDEWDELYSEAYSVLAKNLRFLIESRQLEDVNWIIASTWALTEEVKSFSSPFYNQAFVVEVGPLNWREARQLVLKPSQRVGVDWQGEAVVAVLQETGLRPYLLQLTCTKALDILSAQRDNLVTVPVIRQVLGDIVQEAQINDQYFGFLWEKSPHLEIKKTGIGWMGRLILLILSRDFPQAVSRMAISDAIRELLNEYPAIDDTFFDAAFKEEIRRLNVIYDAIVEKTAGHYTISIPLIQKWLRLRLAQFEQEEDMARLAHAGLMKEFVIWRDGESQEGIAHGH